LTVNDGPFRRTRYSLAPLDAGLDRLAVEEVNYLARRVTAMDPWTSLGISAVKLAGSVINADAHYCVRGIRREDGRLAGLVGVRFPWLYGPYLACLAVLPDHQGCGLGGAVMRWLEREAGAVGGNVWVCASSFNRQALAFYANRGYRHVGVLEDLIAPNRDEILLRKCLSATRGWKSG
jgi:ribosomal protein S18 acetylase RimI-like enzyme